MFLLTILVLLNLQDIKASKFQTNIEVSNLVHKYIKYSVLEDYDKLYMNINNLLNIQNHNNSYINPELLHYIKIIATMINIPEQQEKEDLKKYKLKVTLPTFSKDTILYNPSNDNEVKYTKILSTIECFKYFTLVLWLNQNEGNKTELLQYINSTPNECTNIYQNVYYYSLKKDIVKDTKALNKEKQALKRRISKLSSYSTKQKLQMKIR